MADWLDSLAEKVSNRTLTRRVVLSTGGAVALGAVLGELFPTLAGASKYPCPCGNCSVATIDESMGTVALSACSGTCSAETLCNSTVDMSKFRALTTALAGRGFVPSTTEVPQMLEMLTGSTLFGTVLVLPFQGSGSSTKDAQVITFVPPSGAVTMYAVAYSGTDFLYLLQANAKGKIVSHGAPGITLPKGAGPALDTSETDSLSPSDCQLYAKLMCAVTVTILGRALQAGICAYVALQTGGLAAAACPWIFAVAATLLTTSTDACGKYAKLLCTTQFIYCNCNKTDYTSATTCTSDCEASLRCFTGICEPQSAATSAKKYNFA